MELREAIVEAVETGAAEAEKLDRYLYEHPEIGGEEKLSSAAIVEVLRNNSFTVTYPYLEAELGYGTAFRIFCHVLTVVVASVCTVRYALKIEKDPARSVVYGDVNELAISREEVENHPFGIREKLVLLMLAAGIVILVYGTKTFGWYFTELSALFMILATQASNSGQPLR